MSRTAAAHTVALRDQLAAILRDSDVPLKTPQLAIKSGLPWGEYTCLGLCSTVHAYAENTGKRIVECHGDGQHRLAEPPPTTAVYPHLRALENAGVIARVHYPTGKASSRPRSPEPCTSTSPSTADFAVSIGNTPHTASTTPSLH